eukprot:1159911-Pelagomonas_calceolata.AAC.9
MPAGPKIPSLQLRFKTTGIVGAEYTICCQTHAECIAAPFLSLQGELATAHSITPAKSVRPGLVLMHGHTSYMNCRLVFIANCLSSWYRGSGPAPNFLFGVTMCRPICIHSAAQAQDNNVAVWWVWPAAGTLHCQQRRGVQELVLPQMRAYMSSKVRNEQQPSTGTAQDGQAAAAPSLVSRCAVHASLLLL